MLNFKRFRKVFALTLATVIMLTVVWCLPQGIPPTSAAPAYSLSVSPTYIQEGLDTNITFTISGSSDINTTIAFQINVTTSASVSFLKNFTVTTNAAGAGSNTTNFWKDFSSPANTNRTGTYTVRVNQTLATASFAVGLTEKTSYLRSETVNIRVAGYTANESVIVDLKYGSTSVFTFPQPLSATAGGVVSLSWVIPVDAALGTYAVGVANATSTGTMKTPADIQTFTVEGASEVQVKNLAGQALANVTVEVYNATSGSFISLAQDTNSTGWARFVLGAGNYTFKAFWKNVEVGSVTRNITGNLSLTLEARLSHLKLTVQNATGTLIPWVSLSVSYNYTTRVSETIPESSALTTDLEGKAIMENVFTGINYLISARRYGFVFATTTIQNLSAQAWNNITIVAPTYTMLVKVQDSNGDPAVGLQASVYEWSSGISEALQSKTIDSQGSASFALTVGRYRLRFFEGTAFVSEVTVDLTQDQQSVVIRIDVYKVNLDVVVVDYFGQPLPNFSVEFQRKVDSAYETVATKTTAADGTARFTGVIGGDSRLRVSLAGKLVSSQSLYFAEPSKEVVFKLGAYVSLLGAIMDTSVFVTFVLVFVLGIAFVLFFMRRRLLGLLTRRAK